MSQLIETICIREQKALHLQWHQQRLERSFKALFADATPFDLKAILAEEDFPNGWSKCRVVYDATSYDISITPYQKATFETPVFVDIGKQSYSFKLLDRKWINDLEKDCASGQALLFLKNGKVTDGSYFNVAFQKGNTWLTPATPLLKGTCRERLLQEGLIEPAVIKKSDLHWFSKLRLFNAMTGWENSWELSMENAVFRG